MDLLLRTGNPKDPQNGSIQRQGTTSATPPSLSEILVAVVEGSCSVTNGEASSSRRASRGYQKAWEMGKKLLTKRGWIQNRSKALAVGRAGKGCSPYPSPPMPAQEGGAFSCQTQGSRGGGMLNSPGVGDLEHELKRPMAAFPPTHKKPPCPKHSSLEIWGICPSTR